MHETTGAAKGGWDKALAAAVKAARAEVDAPIAVEITRQWARSSANKAFASHASA